MSVPKAQPQPSSQHSAEISRSNSSSLDTVCYEDHETERAVKRGTWSMEEESALLAALKEHGHDWASVVKSVKTRNEYQIRSHYRHLAKTFAKDRHRTRNGEPPARRIGWRWTYPVETAGLNVVPSCMVESKLLSNVMEELCKVILELEDRYELPPRIPGTMSTRSGEIVMNFGPKTQVKRRKHARTASDTTVPPRRDELYCSAQTITPPHHVQTAIPAPCIFPSLDRDAVACQPTDRQRLLPSVREILHNAGHDWLLL